MANPHELVPQANHLEILYLSDKECKKRKIIFEKAQHEINDFTTHAEVQNHSEECLKSFLSQFYDIQHFRSNIFRKKALAILCPVNAKSSDRLHIIEKSLLDPYFQSLDLGEMMEETASNSIFVWMKTLEADGVLSSFEADPKTAAICHSAGASLYFRSSQEAANKLIWPVAYSIGHGFGAWQEGEVGRTIRGEIEVFVSRKGHHTDWHCDFQENFTVQLKGSKTWLLHENELKHPLRGYTPHYENSGNLEEQIKINKYSESNFRFDKRILEKNCSQVVLKPGDVLYHPAGIWHKVICEEDSVSINISLIAPTWADLITNSLRQALCRDMLGRDQINLLDYNNSLEAVRKTVHLAMMELEKFKNYPQLILPPALADLEIKEELTWKSYKQSVLVFNPLAVLLKAQEYAELEHELRTEEHIESAVYILHVNFGNEAFCSLKRQIYFISPWGQKLMDSLITSEKSLKGKEFAKLVEKANQKKAVSLLSSLKEQGLFTLEIKKRKRDK